jgi:hypothetical protein
MGFVRHLPFLFSTPIRYRAAGHYTLVIFTNIVTAILVFRGQKLNLVYTSSPDVSDFFSSFGARFNLIIMASNSS